MRSRPIRTIVSLSQVYPPDPTSLGQHLADATGELAKRGHRVVHYTANRAYENPTVAFPSREIRDGVDVRRLPLSSFGKGSIPLRLIGGLLFLVQAVSRALFVHGVDVVLVSTSPPMAGIAGVVIAKLRRARLVYWLMDLNPDQAVALGIAHPTSLRVRLYEWMNRVILRRADAVIVLDRFMAERVMAKQDIRERMHIVPPWPHENGLERSSTTHNSFRVEHDLTEKFVVMYSGNHSHANPLRTILAAAVALQDEPDIMFVFVGGGSAKSEVAAAGSKNILSLPYQPLERLGTVLAAADVHVVTMGDDMVGIVHPCKVYGAFAAGRPVLFLGPPQCHVADLIADGDAGWHIRHGDVEGAARTIRALARMPRDRLASHGTSARSLLLSALTMGHLCGRFCDIVDATETDPRSAHRNYSTGSSLPT